MKGVNSTRHPIYHLGYLLYILNVVRCPYLRP